MGYEEGDWDLYNLTKSKGKSDKEAKKYVKNYNKKKIKKSYWSLVKVT